jgi:hypothetical protein
VQFAAGVSAAEQDVILTRGGAEKVKTVKGGNGKDEGDLVLVKVSWRRPRAWPEPGGRPLAHGLLVVSMTLPAAPPH